jgi:hypothetical protein
MTATKGAERGRGRLALLKYPAWETQVAEPHRKAEAIRIAAVAIA